MANRGRDLEYFKKRIADQGSDGGRRKQSLTQGQIDQYAKEDYESYKANPANWPDDTRKARSLKSKKPRSKQ